MKRLVFYDEANLSVIIEDDLASAFEDGDVDFNEVINQAQSVRQRGGLVEEATWEFVSIEER